MRTLNIDNENLNILKKAKDNNRLMHVYLFYGDDKIRMVDTALAFMCSFYNDDLNSKECENILNKNHLNLKMLEKLEGKSLIGKEQISELMLELSRTSLTPGKRFYIIDGIDLASTSAQNSLLKFIEEPVNKEEIIGILCATNFSKVLTTIKSRCGLLYFKTPSDEEIENILKSEFEIDDAFLLSSIAKSKTEAFSIVDSKEFSLAKAVFYDFIEIDNQKDSTLFYLKYKDLDGISFSYFLNFLTKFYNASLHQLKLIFSTIYDKIKEISTNLDLEERKQRLDALLKISVRKESYVQVKYLLHNLLIDFFK